MIVVTATRKSLWQNVSCAISMSAEHAGLMKAHATIARERKCKHQRLMVVETRTHVVSPVRRQWLLLLNSSLTYRMPEATLFRLLHLHQSLADHRLHLLRRRNLPTLQIGHHPLRGSQKMPRALNHDCPRFTHIQCSLGKVLYHSQHLQQNQHR